MISHRLLIVHLVLVLAVVLSKNLALWAEKFHRMERASSAMIKKRKLGSVDPRTRSEEAVILKNTSILAKHTLSQQ